MATIFHHKSNNNKKNDDKYNNYTLERIERKLNKITDLLYSFLRR